ncbi:alpha-L-rhamnosidase [uncultured Dysgonomonas sp.]|uniref:alpha-L-rhamnosidase n=1 Tax=uncultured Dysgonomonas sp. TaxID=206096 RepID=A0A212JD61_9BACT|nr:alpha-L-rhamnosidase [uncultured Dysgonomonas sp.]SBV97371.1 Alpha-L-rhamnosidase [uncultured Dysgonomonas sp.]
MYKINIISVLFLLYSCFSFSLLGAENIKIVNLKTEYTETPLGIDVEKPRFSWQMKSTEQGCYQKAYQIQVTDEKGLKVWDSEKTEENISLNIIYAGIPLKPATRYIWKVSVWDQSNTKHTAESWFETGLMNPDPLLSAWNGAQWIGGDNKDMILYSSYLPVFKIGFSLKLDEASGTTKAGFIYGANDSRLMDKYKNLYKLENGKDTSFLLVELDISSLSVNGSAYLHIYRAGYDPQDKKDVPLKSIPVPTAIINDRNKYEIHRVYLSSVFGYTHIYMDGTEKDNLLGEMNLNPLGQGGDFIAFPMLAEIGFFVPKSQTAYFSDVEIRNYRSPSNILFSEDLKEQQYVGIFSAFSKNLTVKNASYQIEGKDSGVFIIANPERNSMPMLRTTFATSGSEISKARLYVTSRGVYEIFMNGRRIGDDYLNPGLTQYNKTHLYQTYDVTDHLLTGQNAIGATLGEGWWSGGATYTGEFWNFFGDRQSLLAKLVITYSDGKEEVIVTNPSTWNYFNNGPLVYSSFFQGAVYDASRDSLVEGWSMADYDDSEWKNAVETGLTGYISTDPINKQHNMPMADDYTNMRLIGQFGETVKKIKQLTAVSVEEVRPGVFVYDMGQNMAGVPQIKLKGMGAGKRITLRFAEVKYPDLPEYKDNTGMIMLENIRAAMAQDIYITKGGDETINPRFTFHGYRYIEITGIEQPLPLNAVEGEVLSSIHELASHYETSNPKVNKLWKNITWSTFSNFLSIPTDCPQRNERLGWSGDISVFSRTATYLANVSQFLNRHLLAMRDTQREDGRFTDVAPLGGGFGGILWGSAGITVAWENYQQYNDTQMLAEHYDAMESYVDFLIRQIDPDTNIMGNKYRQNWGSLGDWLSPEYDKSEKSLMWEAYFIYDLTLMKKIATVLDKKEDAHRYEELCTERKAFFNKTYIDSETGKTVFPDKDDTGQKRLIDTQVSYALALVFDIFDDSNKEKALNNFVSTITRRNIADIGTICPPYSLMTGFIGTAWINKAISDCERTDIAYRLLQQTDYPSWLYSVEQGATTIWERLNSYTHSDGFGGNNRMNSFNHYSFGAIGAWMYNYSLGIERDEAYPGFKHFILKPEPDPSGEMTYAKGYYDSMYGRIESFWEIRGDAYHYQFSIPANTSATLCLKASSADKVTEGGKPLSSLKGVKCLKSDNGYMVFELQSGDYHIQVRK